MDEKINNNRTISLKQLFILIQKNLFRILLFGVIGGVSAILVSVIFITPRYSSTVDLLVNQRASNDQMQYDVQQADLQAVNTYKDVLKKSVILKPVLNQIKSTINYKGDLQDLENSVSISNETNSQVISVSVKDGNPYTASDIANTIANTFSRKIKKMMKVNNVSIVSKALPNSKPISPNNKLNFAIGVILGLLLGFGWFIFREILDTTIHDEAYLVHDLGIINLGSVGHMSDKKYKAVNIKESFSSISKRV